MNGLSVRHCEGAIPSPASLAEQAHEGDKENVSIRKVSDLRSEPNPDQKLLRILRGATRRREFPLRIPVYQPGGAELRDMP